TIVIGKNKSWKRSSNMGKRNNQNFIGIPHQVMIDMIKYKANLAGITVIQTNESYISQTSSLDHEQPCWENGNKSRKRQGKSPVNRRIKRGLFKANDDRLIKDRKSTRLNSSHVSISYAVICLKKKRATQ